MTNRAYHHVYSQWETRRAECTHQVTKVGQRDYPLPHNTAHIDYVIYNEHILEPLEHGVGWGAADHDTTCWTLTDQHPCTIRLIPTPRQSVEFYVYIQARDET